MTTKTSNYPVNSTSSISHTDHGSDSVSSYDQDTDISSDTSNNGLSTDGNSDTTTESDSSSDSFSDQLSDIETTLGYSATVTNSSTYTDGGSDTESTFDQGTDTSSDASADGLESNSNPDTYTNTESSTDSYADQSYDFENVANGVVATASSSDSSTDSGTDSTSSYDFGSNSESSASQDGLESDSGSDTYTTTESSSDSYGDQSFDSDTESGGQSLSATGTDTDTDSSTDSSWSYDYGTDFPSSASEDGTESDSSSNTYTNTETSGDTSSDQSSDNETESGGSLVLATSSATSTDSETDTSSDVEYGSDTKETPTDSGAEIVVSTYSGTDTSSDTETDTSSDTADDEQGTTTETDATTSDGSGMESSTETSSGTESFDGVEEDDSDYSGAGSFTGNVLDSTTYTNHDDSDLTTDASGLLNGTDTSSDYEFTTWNHSRQDVDSVSTSGDEEPVTLTDQDYGRKTTQANPSTSYSAGAPTEQGGTTVQTDETHSFSEADPYTDVTTDDSTVTTPAGEAGSGNGGSPARAQFDDAPPQGPDNTTTGTEDAAGKAVATLEKDGKAVESQIRITVATNGSVAVSMVKGGALGVLQGVANAANYITDGVVGALNIFLWGARNTVGRILPGEIEYIKGPGDWSHNLVVYESLTAHRISKFAGGAGLTLLVGGGLSSSTALSVGGSAGQASYLIQPGGQLILSAAQAARITIVVNPGLAGAGVLVAGNGVQVLNMSAGGGAGSSGGAGQAPNNPTPPIRTGNWGQGSYGSAEASLQAHFAKHGREVGAADVDQYLRKAEAFAQNLKGATKSPVSGATPGVTRYKKLGKFIDIDSNGNIISFGIQ